MKLGVINHIRCGEPTYERTLVWLPDAMTEDEFAAVVAAARNEYLAFVDSFKKEPPPNDYRPHSAPLYQLYPQETVANVQAMWARWKVEWEAWNAQRQQAKRTFASYLEGRGGITRFYECDPPFSQDLDWGHRHGDKLDYDETKFDG